MCRASWPIELATNSEAIRARITARTVAPPAERHANRDGKRRGNGRRHEGDRLKQHPAEADHAAAQLRWWPRITAEVRTFSGTPRSLSVMRSVSWQVSGRSRTV